MMNLGSATHTAKRAADIIFELQNKDNFTHSVLAQRLNRILISYGEPAPDVISADIDDLQIVATQLHRVFTAEYTEQAAGLLNTLLSTYASPPRISQIGALHLHVDSSDHAPWAEWFAASSALALAILLSEKQRNPGGVCASLSCGKLFIDLGKGGRRLYCSSRCATRERVAAYRSKPKTA